MRVEGNQSTGTPSPVPTPTKYPYPRLAPDSAAIADAVAVLAVLARYMVGLAVVAAGVDRAMATAPPEASADTPAAVASQETAVLRHPSAPDRIASHSTPVAPVELMAPAVAEVLVVLRFSLFSLNLRIS